MVADFQADRASDCANLQLKSERFGDLWQATLDQVPIHNDSRSEVSAEAEGCFLGDVSESDIAIVERDVIARKEIFNGAARAARRRAVNDDLGADLARSCAHYWCCLSEKISGSVFVEGARARSARMSASAAWATAEVSGRRLGFASSGDREDGKLLFKLAALARRTLRLFRSV
jgi:hypothetical protein